MLGSVEMRAPFLDHRIAKFAYKNIPSYLNSDSKEKKILLKDFAKRVLYEEFDYNRKQDFNAPIGEWFTEQNSLDRLKQVLLDGG